jgi:hypothetical protein
MAILFALIAMLASFVSARSCPGQRFAGMASKIVNTIIRVRHFFDRQMKLLPRFGVNLLHN